MSTPRDGGIPAGLRARLEAARLDSLALLRALDQLGLLPAELPQSRLHELFELDADCVEALWGLDQPPGRLSAKAMVRDTLASLERLPTLRNRLREGLPARARAALAAGEPVVRASLTLADAYTDVPGRDPQIR
jgi:hypothetical protein